MARLNEIPEVFGDIKFYESNEHGQAEGQFSVTYQYFNTYRVPITVVQNNNLPITVRPDPASALPYEELGFTIRRIYQFNSNKTIHDTARTLGRMVDEIESSKLDRAIVMLRELLDRALRLNNKTSRLKFVCDLRIDPSMIERNAVSYVAECDVMLSLDTTLKDKPHPRSPEGKIRYEFLQQNKNPAMVAMSVQVVDNEMRKRVRYMYAAKRVVAVPSEEDLTRQSGVYFTLNAQDETDRFSPNSAFLTFEQAEQMIGLYGSQDEAITAGNPEVSNQLEDLRLSQELKTLENSNRRLSLELEAQRAETARYKDASETAKANLQHAAELHRIARDEVQAISKDVRAEEQEKFKMSKELDKTEREIALEKKLKKLNLKATKRKDYYENRSAKRKDTAELIKYIPVAIAAATSIWMIASSRKKEVGIQGF